VDDPKKLAHQKPEYIRHKPGIEDPEMHSEMNDPDRQSNIGTDPMETSETTVHKTIVSPDPEKVREHDRERARQPRDPRDG